MGLSQSSDDGDYTRRKYVTVTTGPNVAPVFPRPNNPIVQPVIINTNTFDPPHHHHHHHHQPAPLVFEPVAPMNFGGHHHHHHQPPATLVFEPAAPMNFGGGGMEHHHHHHHH